MWVREAIRDLPKKGKKKEKKAEDTYLEADLAPKAAESASKPLSQAVMVVRGQCSHLKELEVAVLNKRHFPTIDQLGRKWPTCMLGS